MPKSKEALEPREKAKHLIELAANSGASVEERQSAAIKACAIIRKYDLLSNPLDAFNENQTVRAARTVLDAFNDPKIKEARDTLFDGFKGLRRAVRRRHS